MIKDPWLRALVIIMVFIAGLYLIGLVWQVAVQFFDIIILFFLAWILSFLLDPVVQFLVQHIRLPRSVAASLVYLGLLVLLSVGTILLVPTLSEQLVQINRQMPDYVATVGDWLTDAQVRLEERGVHLELSRALNYDEMARRVESLGPQVLSNAVGLAAGVANTLFQIVIIIILSFYITVDSHRLAAALVDALPARYGDDVRFFLATVNRAFGGFLRGQMVQSLVYGLGTAIIMQVLGLPFVLLSSVFGAVVMLIPFVGPFIAMLLPLVIAALTRPEVFWWALVTLLALQQLVFNIIAPRVMSKAVGLHPLLVFLAVLAGAKLAGIWGAIFGVPVLAVAATMVSFYRLAVYDRQAYLAATASRPDPATQNIGKDPVYQ